ncbi:MAG: hypothetical protein AABW59_02660 [archaeon]
MGVKENTIIRLDMVSSCDQNMTMQLAIDFEAGKGLLLLQRR